MDVLYFADTGIGPELGVAFDAKIGVFVFFFAILSGVSETFFGD